MTDNEIQKILERILSLPAETEVVEFKEAKIVFALGQIAKYYGRQAEENQDKQSAVRIKKSKSNKKFRQRQEACLGAN